MGKTSEKKKVTNSLCIALFFLTFVFIIEVGNHQGESQALLAACKSKSPNKEEKGGESRVRV